MVAWPILSQIMPKYVLLFWPIFNRVLEL